jgi:salicylate hydroxylase
MSPNGVRHWFEWGLGPDLLEKSLMPAEMKLRRWRNGEYISRTELNPDLQHRFGAPYLVLHRADLHSVLFKHAVKLGVDIRVASRVIEYDFDVPKFKLFTGEVIQPDLVVAVDGQLGSSFLWFVVTD